MLPESPLKGAGGKLAAAVLKRLWPPVMVEDVHRGVVWM
jgi:hypothetical protein